MLASLLFAEACAAPCVQAITGTLRIRGVDGAPVSGSLQVTAGAVYVTPELPYCTEAPAPPLGDTLTLDVQ